MPMSCNFFRSSGELTPPEAAGILRDTELTGDEERIVSALTAAVHRLEELADSIIAGAGVLKE